MYKLSIIGDIAYEETISANGTVKTIGGSGFYAALGASMVKNNNYTIVSSIGTDFDFQKYSLLGLPKDNLLVSNLPTGKFITTFLGDGTREFSSDEGALSIMNIDAVTELLLSDIIFLSGSNPRKQLKWIELLKYKKYSGKIAVDVFEGYCVLYKDIIGVIFENADFIFMNQVEYKLLRYCPLPDKVSIIKYGEKGAELWNSDRYYCPAPSIKNVKSTNGAGDILAAVFLSNLLQGDSQEIALRKGVEIASKSTGYDWPAEMVCK